MDFRAGGHMRRYIGWVFASTVWLVFSGLGGAVAADMAVKAPLAAPPVAVYSWTGFYVGLNAGYGWGDSNVVYTPPGPPAGFLPIDVVAYRTGPTQGLNVDGFTGGGQAGYNYQISQFVLGIEGDIGYLARQGNFSGTFPGGYGPQNVNISGKGGWLATIRGRVGVTFDRFLVYATGGAAFTDAGVNIGNFFPSPQFGARDASTSMNTRTGWAAGGGVEYAILQNWSIKVEYLRLQFDNSSPTAFSPGMLAPAVIVPHQYNVSGTDNIVRVGVNYRFGLGGPVVAKY
jgi:outer membrane immunogenic protein